MLATDGAAALIGRFDDWTLHHLLPPRAGRSAAIALEPGAWMRIDRGATLALRPDGEVLAILIEGRGSLYDALSGKLLQHFTLEGRPTNRPTDLRFAPDGACLVVTLGFGGTIIVDARCRWESHPFRAMAIAPDGQRAAIGDGHTVKIGEIERLAPSRGGPSPPPPGSAKTTSRTSGSLRTAEHWPPRTGATSSR